MANFKLWTFEDVNVSLHVQSHRLIHISAIHCHKQSFFTSGCAFVYKLEIDLQEDNFIEQLRPDEIGSPEEKWRDEGKKK